VEPKPKPEPDIGLSECERQVGQHADGGGVNGQVEGRTEDNVHAPPNAASSA